MNPPFSNEGTTATHSAEPKTSSGMPVSGADSISFRTVAAACTRSSALVLSLFSSFPKASAGRIKTNRSRSVFFIVPQLFSEFGETLILKDMDAVRIAGGVRRADRIEVTCTQRVNSEWWEAKKFGADSGDPNLHSQPRLPGSVVGERSMRHIHSTHKITGDTVPK